MTGNECYQNIGELWGSEANKAQRLHQLERQGGFVAEPKHDGIWCSVEIDAADVVIRSRTGRRQNVPELEAAVAECQPTRPKDQGFLARLLGIRADTARTVLIGELSVGTTEAVNRRQQVGHVVVDAFDIIVDRGRDVSSESLRCRRARLVEVLERPGLSEWLRLVPQWTRDFARHYADEKEGLVLKRASSAYTVGSANENWIKVKKQHTADCVVIDWNPSKRRGRRGREQAASVLCGAFDARGVLVPLVKVPMLDDELSRRVAREFAFYRGRVIEISHYGATRKGSLRHPGFVRFRHDKAPEECHVVLGA